MTSRHSFMSSNLPTDPPPAYPEQRASIDSNDLDRLSERAVKGGNTPPDSPLLTYGGRLFPPWPEHLPVHLPPMGARSARDGRRRREDVQPTLPARPLAVARPTDVARETNEGIMLQTIARGVGEVTLRAGEPGRDRPAAGSLVIAAPAPQPPALRPSAASEVSLTQERLLQSTINLRRWIIVGLVLGGVMVVTGFAFWFGYGVREAVSAD